MLKKTLIIGAVALASAGVAAADNFYAGLGVGGSGFHNNVGGTVGGLSASNDSGALGVVGGIFGGYNFTFPDQINLGLEIFGNATSDKITINNTYANGVTDVAVNTNLKLRYTYGIRVLPAYMITPDTDIHIIGGYVRGNFQFNANGYTQNTNRNGYQVGLGSTTNINKNFAVRGDMIYSGYNNNTYSDNTYGTSVTAKTNTFDGIISGEYKFG